MFERFKQKFEENKKQFLTVAFGVSALGLFFYFKNRPSKPEDEKKALRKDDEILNSSKAEGDDLQSKEEKALVRVINKLKKILTGDIIDYEAVKEIYKSQYELSRQEFKNAILSNRRERRKLLNNLPEYQKLFLKYETQVDEIHNKHLNAILAHFRIDKGGWMQLTEGAAARFSEQWGELLISTEEQELESIREKNKPKLRLPVLIEIQKYRLKVLLQKIEQFKAAFPLLDQSDLYNLVEKWGADNVYAKFLVQEEDIIYSKHQLTPQEKQQLQTHEENVQNLMQDLLVDQPHSESDTEPVVIAGI